MIDMVDAIRAAAEALDAQPVDPPHALYLTKATCARIYGKAKADDVWADFGAAPVDALIFWDDGRITRP